MSKSDESDMTRINLTDDADAIAKKIRKAKTDPEPLPSEVKGLESAARGRQSRRHLCRPGRDEQGGGAARVRRRAFSKFKEALAELAATRLTPIGEEMRRLMADPVEIDRILAEGARRAHAIADPILAKTKDIVGFIRG